MKPEEINKIYERLLEINFKVDVNSLPDPQTINQKIGECHAYIEEVEHFNIKIHRELSVFQQAINNACTAFDMKKDTLLTEEPIRSLPNIRDREAKANLLLKDDKNTIKDYQNQLTDLNNLLKAINLKIKNLNRANTDIKLIIRTFETQTRLGTTPHAAHSLISELEKSTFNKDSFEDSTATSKAETFIDPSNINVNDLFDESSDSTAIPEKEQDDTKPTPNLKPVNKESSDSMSILKEEQDYIEPVPDLKPTDNEKKETIDDWLDEEVDSDSTVNLDLTLEDEATKNTDQDSIGIDIDELLNDF